MTIKESKRYLETEIEIEEQGIKEYKGNKAAVAVLKERVKAHKGILRNLNYLSDQNEKIINVLSSSCNNECNRCEYYERESCLDTYKLSQIESIMN